mgnify:CR=1 FL=1
MEALLPRFEGDAEIADAKAERTEKATEVTGCGATKTNALPLLVRHAQELPSIGV